MGQTLKTRQFESQTAYKIKLMSEMTELTKKEEEIRQAELELRKPMDLRVKEWLLDFMNLIFGSSEESRTFWDEVLLPEAAVYYYDSDL